MKTYTVIGGLVETGWKTSDDANGGHPCVVLGEYGKGAWAERLPFHHSYPAVVKESKVEDAFLYDVNRGKKPKKFFVLANPTKEDKDVLVRFVTKGKSEGKVNGAVHAMFGRKFPLVAGHGLNNCIKDNGTWTDAIFLMRPGDIFRVELGGSGEQFAVFLRDSALVSVTWDDEYCRKMSPAVPTKDMDVQKTSQPEVQERTKVTTELDPMAELAMECDKGCESAPPSHLKGYAKKQWYRTRGSHVEA